MKVIPAVGVLIIKHGKVLLVKHGVGSGHVNGVYGLPAGRIDVGESEKQAAVRELHEETGLSAKEEDLEELNLNLSPVEILRKDGNAKLFSMRVFLCRRYYGELARTDEADPEWVDVNEIDKLQLLPNVKEIIVASIKANGDI